MGERKGDWVVLRELSDMFQLQSDQALLESEGIAAGVMSMQDSMYPSMSRYRLMVLAESEERAREILKGSLGDE